MMILVQNCDSAICIEDSYRWFILSHYCEQDPTSISHRTAGPSNSIVQIAEIIGEKQTTQDLQHYLDSAGGVRASAP